MWKTASCKLPDGLIVADIDYMKGYRDFENDPERYSYDEGERFLSKIHANNQHYVPIVDSAIYAPNPEDPNDAYPAFERGVDANAFVMNPDGSLYIGAVWPGYTGNHPSSLVFDCRLSLHSIPRLGWRSVERQRRDRLVDR